MGWLPSKFTRKTIQITRQIDIFDHASKSFMRFAESPLKYLLLPLVPLTAIGIVEFVDLATTEYSACCMVDAQHPNVSVEARPVSPPPPAPPAPHLNNNRTAPPA